jgi:hypothetical protein
MSISKTMATLNDFEKDVCIIMFEQFHDRNKCPVMKEYTLSP